MSNRLDQEREARLQPLRIERAVKKLHSLGIIPTKIGSDSVEFLWKGYTVKFFAYSGWHTGKTIKDGRGFDNLFKQLEAIS